MPSQYALHASDPLRSEWVWEVEETYDVSATELDLSSLRERCRHTPFLFETMPPVPSGAENLAAAFAVYASNITEAVRSGWQVTLLERLLGDVRSRLNRLEQHQTVIVPIETFEPEPFQLLKSFSVVVEPVDSEFTATWYDAGISASGDSIEDAIANLKEMVLSTYEFLHSEPKLGAALQRQKSILSSAIRPR